MRRDADIEKFWDREVVAPSHRSWMADPIIRDYINQSISDSDEPLWPMDWFARWLCGRRFRRALSIGCGSGALERDLVSRNLVDSIDAFDGSTNSLRVARETAEQEGLALRIRYFAADFNEPVLPPRRWDAVFIHQAAHHVRKLEKLFRAVLLALKPDGILYLDEYIGPSRNHWNPETVADHRRVFNAYPDAAKRLPELPGPIEVNDLSEAIRSAEIVPQLAIGFDTAVMRPYGGNLLSVIYPHIDFGMVPGGIEALIEREKKVLASGEMPYYAIIVAKPKRGLAKRLASWRYFTEPKVRRVLRDLRAKLGLG